MKLFSNQFNQLCFTFCLVGLMLYGCTNGGVKETFSLAWSDSSDNVHVQFSGDGITWQDAKIPTSIKSNVGVGLAADPIGLEYLLVGQSSNGDRLGLFSLGPDGYMIRPPEKLASPSVGKMDSGPSVAAASLERWYLAYRNEENVKVDFLERVGEGKVGSVTWKNTWKDETPLLNVNNTSVQGWPSISINDKRVVVSWFRQPSGTSGELQLAVGDIQANGSIKWLGGQVFPNSEPKAGGVELEHDITNDGKNFLLGVTRKEGSQSNANYGLYLYKSIDGMKWALENYVGMNTQSVKESFRNNSPLAIAKNSKGVILVAEYGGGVSCVWRFDKQWSKASTKVFSGYPASKTRISLIANVQ